MKFALCALDTSDHHYLNQYRPCVHHTESISIGTWFSRLYVLVATFTYRYTNTEGGHLTTKPLYLKSILIILTSTRSYQWNTNVHTTAVNFRAQRWQVVQSALNAKRMVQRTEEVKKSAFASALRHHT